MTRVFVSIVSHGQQHLVHQTGVLGRDSGLDVLVRENLPSASASMPGTVRAYSNEKPIGFGANHNLNFKFAAPGSMDWFVVFNPDLETNPGDVLELIDRAIKSECVIAAPLLWNAHLDCFDQNARPFPTLTSLLLSFLGAPGRSRYDEKDLSGLERPDWVSGAFLAIRADTYRALGGFDERYFMYMEDVDLCLRARRLGVFVRFFPEVKMIHNARRGSRSVFDRLFWHHLASSLRYFARQLRR